MLQVWERRRGVNVTPPNREKSMPIRQLSASNPYDTNHHKPEKAPKHEPDAPQKVPEHSGAISKIGDRDPPKDIGPVGM
jgi:hypothetical protein